MWLAYSWYCFECEENNEDPLTYEEWKLSKGYKEIDLYRFGDNLKNR